MKTLSKEDLKYLNHHLTIGKLREFLNNSDLPDDGLVMIERVKDGQYTPEFREESADEAKVQESMNQYHPAWCVTTYTQDDNLFIDLHY